MHDLGPLCVNAMKETMFEGKEILDRMLQDADEANRTPEEIEEDNAIKKAREEKEAKEEAERIMNDLKGDVEETAGKPNDTIEDLNNNISEKEISNSEQVAEGDPTTETNINNEALPDSSVQNEY